MTLQAQTQRAMKVHILPEFIRYIIAGLINTAVSFLLYSGCIIFLGAPIWLSNLVAVIGGVLCGYVLARKFVFTASEQRSHTGTSARYFFTIALQYAASTLIIMACIRYGFGEIWSYIAALPIAILLSYGLQKYWVFPQTLSSPDTL